MAVVMHEPGDAPKEPSYAIVASTTGTAPIEFVLGPKPDEVHVYFQYGGGNVYSRAAILAALGTS